MRAPARSACFTGLAFLFFTICQIAWADDCPNGILPPGTGQDIVISVSCAVDGSAPNGLYQYGNVNIIANGKLTFDDVKVDFWAKNILVENNGSLLAGTTMPVGTNGGSLTIHLYGPDQGPGGKGVACVSDDKGQCGIPDNIWDSNGSEKVCLNGVQQNCSDGILDYFYQYMPIDYDDGNPQAYFGYKVLAVSYGGTLELFGAKGATYSNLPISSSGTSWARLNASVTTTSNTLTLDRVVDWKNGDQIVVTTTDYLPGHSEQLTVTSNTVMGTYSVIGFKETLQYPHNGQQYPIAATVPAGIGPDPDPNLPPCNPQLPSLRCVDTRAAVGLLTHSIRIVSGGDTLLAPFPAASTHYYFGGHTLFRQGFKAVEIQGVEFAQLGQGGKIMHYPVHFHMARITNPANTYVLDSSINESMTRWIVIHSTQDVTVARNVGWESIGHGYYLEDGTEAYNKFYSNLGIFARAAVMASNNSAEKYNPRHVPGILAAPYPAGGSAQPQEQVPYHSDVDHPTDFWITNGWNDFGYNHMAGAGT
ncbi:MAG: G8 domain-containing protein, partial [Candidatus Korobacteraceae bacterium]